MKNQKVFIITGLSGSGKSTAISAFEDAGFYCVDNMPMELVSRFFDLPLKEDPEIKGFVFVMDVRARNFLPKYSSGISLLEEKGLFPKTIFLKADEDTLINRFSQTRRHHPMSHHKSLMESIRAEKIMMLSLEKNSDILIDTTDFNVHKLKSVILDIVHTGILNKNLMKINIISFGYKYGIPHDADILIDMRFLPNPFFVPDLKDQDGESKDVKNFVLSFDETKIFLKKYLDIIDFLLPLYRKENKAYLTIGVGCTGGRHRSVVIAREMFEHINSKKLKPGIIHRDIDRDVKPI
ncbi:MAG: RNase adapter RapZ [Desulfobacteraceae bacterium]|nr:RNase adapter RapZ [Desulfobacteraceae bacterium]